MKDRSGACPHRAHRLIGRRDLQRDDCNNILINTAPQGLGGEEQVWCYGTLKTEASTQDNGQRQARSTLSEGMLYSWTFKEIKVSKKSGELRYVADGTLAMETANAVMWTGDEYQCLLGRDLR